MTQPPPRTLCIYNTKAAPTSPLTLMTRPASPPFVATAVPSPTWSSSVARDPKSIVGSATYHPTNRLGVSTASNITLKSPSSGTAFLNKRRGGFFSSDRRTMRRSTVLGPVYWNSRQVNNPWKGGLLETECHAIGGYEWEGVGGVQG